MEQYLEFIGNHPYMFAALAATLGMIVYVEYERLSSGAASISPLAMTRLQNDGALVMDIRDDVAFTAAHVIDAVNVPLAQIEKRVGEFEKYKSQPVVVLCENGIRSQRACKKLKKAGFSQLHQLQGGMAAWEKANLPIASRA